MRAALLDANLFFLGGRLLCEEEEMLTCRPRVPGPSAEWTNSQPHSKKEAFRADSFFLTRPSKADAEKHPRAVMDRLSDRKTAADGPP